MTSRPLVSVMDSSSATVVVTVTLPAVFTAPIRSDIVRNVHTLMAKNSRQAYAVSVEAGHQTPAKSWGTGRAVSRIPRVPGGGTSRSGQGAFGNMCRGGRMFAPTKIWRKWHKKISVNQRRYAVVSALAATAIPALVMARGHQIDNVPEFPLVISDDIITITKTKEAKNLLQLVGAFEDVVKVELSKKVRRGVGKSRNRRYTQRRGPLIIYDVSEGLHKAFRNLPGIQLSNVDNLSLLDLAPGGHLGRFCIWSKGAFEKLDSIFGTYEESAHLKSGYRLPRPMMTNADLTRLINSDEIQSILKPVDRSGGLTIPKKRNPLKHASVKTELNPFHRHISYQEVQRKEADKRAREDAKSGGTPYKKGRTSLSTTFSHDLVYLNSPNLSGRNEFTDSPSTRFRVEQVYGGAASGAVSDSSEELMAMSDNPMTAASGDKQKTFRRRQSKAQYEALAKEGAL